MSIFKINNNTKNYKLIFKIKIFNQLMRIFNINKMNKNNLTIN